MYPAVLFGTYDLTPGLAYPPHTPRAIFAPAPQRPQTLELPQLIGNPLARGVRGLRESIPLGGPACVSVRVVIAIIPAAPTTLAATVANFREMQSGAAKLLSDLLWRGRRMDYAAATTC
jgi:hypothetical protein